MVFELHAKKKTKQTAILILLWIDKDQEKENCPSPACSLDVMKLHFNAILYKFKHNLKYIYHENIEINCC